LAVSASNCELNIKNQDQNLKKSKTCREILPYLDLSIAHWYHSGADLIWPDSPFKIRDQLCDFDASHKGSVLKTQNIGNIAQSWPAKILCIPNITKR
jgi:hypothetical protein